MNSSSDPRARLSAIAAACVHPLSVSLLGGLRLAGVREGDATGYESRHHVRAVLALAGSSSRGMLRDEVVELLWPNSRTDAARNRLYHTVHLARQALAVFAWDDEWLVVRNGRVLFDERVWCDVHELEHAVEAGVADLGADPLHAALTHCHADWVPGLEIGSAGEAVRVRVRGLQATLLREAIGRHATQGDTPAQRELLQNLIRVQPTDEWAYRELMRLDLGAGRRHAVLRTFESISRELTIRLGLRPTAETCAVAAVASAELQGPAGLAVPEPGAAVFSTVGREPLIQDLVAQLGSAPGLWNLTGLSGIGKTCVVREVMRRLAPTLAGGVHVISMGDMAPGTSAVAACARAIGLASSGQGDELEPLVRALELRQMLLFIDDLDAASDVERLLASLPFGSMQARLIVTSRARVEQPSAIHVVVPALTVPALGASRSQAGQCAGFALFQLRCPVASREQDSDAWQRDAAELVRRLDGLPLAIELAALRTATMTPGEILAQIERGVRPLGDGPGGLPSRHRSLQASLDWSVQLLGPAARHAYGAASVFPGGFGRADMAPLMAAAGLATDAADAALGELAAAGLLVREPDGARLRMLHLPRAHARAQAVERGQWQSLLTARLNEVCRQLEENALEFESPTYTARLQRVIELEEDAMALLEHARVNDPERFVRMLVPLCESWGMRGFNSMVLQWAEPAVESARSLCLVDAELSLRFAMTKSLGAQNSDASAERNSQTLLPLVARTSNAVLRARVLVLRSGVLDLRGREPESLAMLHGALTDWRIGPETAGYWTIYSRLALLHAEPPDVGFDIDELRRRFDGSALWPYMLRCVVLSNSRIDWAHRYEFGGELVACGKRMRAAPWVRIGLESQAEACMGLGNMPGARSAYEEAVLLMREAGSRRDAANGLMKLAELNWRLLEFDAASLHLNEAAGLLVSGQHEALVVEIPLQWSIISALRGNAPAATNSMLSVPIEQLGQVADAALFVWAEACALLALLLGHDALATELAELLRQLDADGESYPMNKRFRDHRLGSAGSSVVSEPAQREVLRSILRSKILSFCELLVSDR